MVSVHHGLKVLRYSSRGIFMKLSPIFRKLIQLGSLVQASQFLITTLVSIHSSHTPDLHHV